MFLCANDLTRHLVDLLCHSDAQQSFMNEYSDILCKFILSVPSYCQLTNSVCLWQNCSGYMKSTSCLLLPQQSSIWSMLALTTLFSYTIRGNCLLFSPTFRSSSPSISPSTWMIIRLLLKSCQPSIICFRRVLWMRDLDHANLEAVYKLFS